MSDQGGKMSDQAAETIRSLAGSIPFVERALDSLLAELARVTAERDENARYLRAVHELIELRDMLNTLPLDDIAAVQTALSA